MDAVAFVYKITNTLNGMEYIGVTKNPKGRLRAHACTTTPTKSIIKNALKKYGREVFKMELLIQGTQEYCYEMEAKLINAFNTLTPNGYNICTGGRGAIGIYGEKNGMFGRKHSPETLEKMRAVRAGKKISEETKEKMRLAHLGQKRTPEQCERIRQAALNRSEEVKERIRVARKAGIERAVARRRGLA